MYQVPKSMLAAGLVMSAELIKLRTKPGIGSTT